jgi:hypothetical protein
MPRRAFVAALTKTSPQISGDLTLRTPSQLYRNST